MVTVAGDTDENYDTNGICACRVRLRGRRIGLSAGCPARKIIGNTNYQLKVLPGSLNRLNRCSEEVAAGGLLLVDCRPEH
jgi:hypothetical protein